LSAPHGLGRKITTILRLDRRLELKAAAPSFGVQLTRAEVRDADEIERASVFAQQPNGALLVVPGAVSIRHAASSSTS
jgi:hypothetical protein